MGGWGQRRKRKSCEIEGSPQGARAIYCAKVLLCGTFPAVIEKWKHFITMTLSFFSLGEPSFKTRNVQAHREERSQANISKQ